jgi:hypothetical protein
MRYFLIGLFLFVFTGIFSQQVKFSGTVTDTESGETLTGASIFIKQSGEKIISDLDGNFSVSLTPGTYTFEISLISYDRVIIQNFIVKNQTEKSLEIRLNPSGTEISKKNETKDGKQFLIWHNEA